MLTDFSYDFLQGKGGVKTVFFLRKHLKENSELMTLSDHYHAQQWNRAKTLNFKNVSL